ncbi:MAG TPA: alpha/beta hydrolase [Anaerolineae bacterium]|nr:alpha/beta hydrolase [Anaerolineae bacterium]HQI85324.1 alpha/beta hydrolase [Anaerolineae bacterium]
MQKRIVTIYVRWLLVFLLLLTTLSCSLLESNERAAPTAEESDADAAAPDNEYAEETEEVATASADGKWGVFEAADCEYEDLADVTLECGYVAVPQDHRDPGSDTIWLAVTIVRSGGAAKPDPVVYLAGGPGGSATDDVEGWLDQAFLEERDLILFDQRGTGSSEPSLNCAELEGESGQKDVEAAQECRDRLEAEGIDLTLYNSAQSAADLDMLRRALGYESWNLLGISYGTRLALTAMRDYPAGIRSVILDSGYPPEVDAYEQEALNGVRAIETLLAGCAADAACNKAYPDLEGRFYRLLSALDENPVEFTAYDPEYEEDIDVLLDGSELVNRLFQALYDAEVIPVLPYVIDLIDRGEYETAYAWLLGDETAYARPRQEEEEDFTDSEGLFYSVECNEEAIFNDLDAARQAVEAADSAVAEYLYVDVEAMFEICKIWGAGAASAIETQPVRSDIPTLLLAGDYDPITPPAWAESAARYLSNGYLFVFPGVGHSVVDSGECAQSLVTAFLNAPNKQPDGRCVIRMRGPDFYVGD